MVSRHFSWPLLQWKYMPIQPSPRIPYYRTLFHHWEMGTHMWCKILQYKYICYTKSLSTVMAESSKIRRTYSIDSFCIQGCWQHSLQISIKLKDLVTVKLHSDRTEAHACHVAYIPFGDSANYFQFSTFSISFSWCSKLIIPALHMGHLTGKHSWPIIAQFHGLLVTLSFTLLPNLFLLLWDIIWHKWLVHSVCQIAEILN